MLRTSEVINKMKSAVYNLVYNTQNSYVINTFFLFPWTEMSANPLNNDGIEPGAFEGVNIYHIRIAEAKLTSIPKGMLCFTFSTLPILLNKRL